MMARTVDQARRLEIERKREAKKKRALGKPRRVIHENQAPKLSRQPNPTRPGEKMGKGELYEYFKRMGRLEMYFAMFPNG